jgi:uncharacterized membrane protein YidH (DUF202 family)
VDDHVRSATAGRGPWDPGLQSERTALAWQRTLLSGLACSLVVARLLALVSWPAAVVAGIAAVVTTAALGVLARRRFRRNDDAVRDRRPLADAHAPLLLSVLVVLTALAAAVVVLGSGPQS